MYQYQVIQILLIHFFLGSETAGAFLRVGLAAPKPGFVIDYNPSFTKGSPFPSTAVVDVKN